MRGLAMQRERRLDALCRPDLEARAGLSRRSFIAHGTAAAAAAALPAAAWAAVDLSQFKRVPTQYIAALGPSNATSGNDAETWGWWSQDPGPRGVRLKYYDRLANGV